MYSGKEFNKLPIYSNYKSLKSNVVAKESKELKETITSLRNQNSILIKRIDDLANKVEYLNEVNKALQQERDNLIITIEDSAELQIKNIPNIVRLEVRNANVEGKQSICIRELIKTALRMRPSRIIVGEVRDSAAIDLLDAYNTGHEGSLSTGHANSAYDMLSRLESMVLMGMDMPINVIRRKIASAIDIVIHLGRLRDNSRSVLEISEVVGTDENDCIILNKLYEYKEREVVKDKLLCSNKLGTLVRSNEIKNIDKLIRAGIKM
jgi:pilus assembly protein CpaF